MNEPREESERIPQRTLEHTDLDESLRQLRWTIGVTVVGLAVLAWFYL